MDVVLVWGGWSCNAGYIHWAYVAEALVPNEDCLGKRIDDIDAYAMSRIGKRLFEPAKTPEAQNIAEKWIKDNNYNLVGHVRMRTD